MFDNLEAQLQKFAEQHYPGPVKVRDVGPMEDGHAGLTFGVTIINGESGAVIDDLVLRLAPKGVTRKGNTDVYRQAPLLRALYDAGQPVPPIRWADAGEEEFESPYVMMEKFPGKTCIIWDPDPIFPRTDEAMAPIWLQAAEALADIHLFDWKSKLGDWEDAVPVADEIHKWERIYAKAPEAEWAALGEEVRNLLLARPAPDSPVGLFHGDYQPGNVLYDDGKLVAVLDWEISGIGAQLLDIGWLLMMGDPLSWHEKWHPVCPPPIADMVAAYEARMGRNFPAIPWYQALAGYRFASISCLNVRLHRKGQRHDPMWEEFAHAVPNLFGRARDLLVKYYDSSC